MVVEDVDRAAVPEAVDHLRGALSDGRRWPEAILEAMALWSVPEETYLGRHYHYFIGGEAFDWLLLAERLCRETADLIPERECEELLFQGCFPYTMEDMEVRHLLGVDKYRGYLNYFYGVTVEEALQTVVEAEVEKRRVSNGNRYQDDFAGEAYLRIYRRTEKELLEEFHLERQSSLGQSMKLAEVREFTYWLFKYRLKNSDKARIASDTRKGLHYLEQLVGGRPGYLWPGAA